MQDESEVCVNSKIIFSCVKPDTVSEVILKTNKYINKFKTKNPKFANFFKEVKAQLLEYVQDLENENIDDEDDDVLSDFMTTPVGVENGGVSDVFDNPLGSEGNEAAEFSLS